MKQIVYTLRVKEVGDPDTGAWSEKQNAWVQDDMSEEQHGRNIVDYFNSSLKSYEKPREFVGVILPEDETRKTDAPQLMHKWSKVSLVTENGGYDRMRCEVCGVTGKRYALGTSVRPDKKTQQYCKGIKK